MILSYEKLLDIDIIIYLNPILSNAALIICSLVVSLFKPNKIPLAVSSWYGWFKPLNAF